MTEALGADPFKIRADRERRGTLRRWRKSATTVTFSNV